MSDFHLADLDGAYRRLRDAVVAETRTFHADFAETTFGDSRLIADGVGALGLLDRMGLDFAIIPVGDNIGTTKTSARERLRRYSLRLILAERAGDKTNEDTFFDRLELVENRWGAKTTFVVDVDGDGLTVEFLVEIESNGEFTVETNENHEVTGHAAERRLLFEVNACAS